MPRAARRLALLAAALGAVLCTHAADKPCAPGDRRCEVVREMEASPVRRLDHWRTQMSRPFEERVGIGSELMVRYLALDAEKNDIPDRPRVSQADGAFVADVRMALATLPASVKRAVASRLAGVYLVDSIGSTGFGDSIRDGSGRAVAGFVVLDPTALARTANEWFSWRESTPFRPAAGWSISATLENPPADDRRNAIQYILLHELAHVLSIDNDVHPPWDAPPPRELAPGRYPFFDVSWSVTPQGKYETLYDAWMPQRKDIVYYFGPRLDIAQAAELYAKLARTDFATAYASTSPGDDFAEAFASFVHTELLRRPFEIRVMHDGKAVQRFGACWRERRCAAKRAILEGLLL